MPLSLHPLRQTSNLGTNVAEAVPARSMDGPRMRQSSLAPARANASSVSHPPRHGGRTSRPKTGTMGFQRGSSAPHTPPDEQLQRARGRSSRMRIRRDSARAAGIGTVEEPVDDAGPLPTPGHARTLLTEVGEGSIAVHGVSGGPPP